MREFRYTGRFKEGRLPRIPIGEEPDFFRQRGIRPPLPREQRMTYEQATRPTDSRSAGK